MNIYQKLFPVSTETCHQCQQKDTNLVSPCGNLDCSVRFHNACLNKYVDTHLPVCPRCSQTVVSTKTQVLDRCALCTSVYQSFLHVLYIVVNVFNVLLCITTPIVLMLCTSIPIRTPVCDKEVYCMVSFILTIVIYGLYLFMLLIGCTSMEINIKNYIRPYTKHWRKTTILLITLATNGIITLCHLVGMMILTFIFHQTQWFNFMTFFTGFIASLISVTISGMIICIYWWCSRYWSELYQEHTEEKVIYGVYSSVI